VSIGDQVFDVLIVGAGLAGIGAARDLQRLAPGVTIKIVEARTRVGGTWDLFRYPGLRSDSDFQTLGYADRPINNGAITAEGAEIRAYIEAAARERGLDKAILFEHRVIAADFDSAAGLWRVSLEVGAGKAPSKLQCRFVYWCSGYYDYAGGYQPEWPGLNTFAGTLIHPQHWPEDYDATGKRIIVIGSGATAVTLVPALAAKARHVVMLQRSPSYILAAPRQDAIATFYICLLPVRAAYALTRWRNIWLSLGLYRIARRWPEKVRNFLLRDAQKRLGVDAEAMKNFTPRYNPWDQRLCLDPDGGFYAALLKGSASVVTGEIETFAPDGLRLRDGESLRADTIISATGLKLQLFGGATISVDGGKVETGAAMTYKGCMFAGTPNMLAAFGYANASWTLKCGATTRYLARLLAFMRAQNFATATPQGAPEGESEPVLTLSSGYVQRGLDILPRQGKAAPWRYSRDYPRDLLALRFGRIDDGVLQFTRR